MNDLGEAILKEEGTLNCQYYVSDEGDVLVYERFKDVVAAQTPIDTWDRFAARWIAAAEPTCMVHLGDLPPGADGAARRPGTSLVASFRWIRKIDRAADDNVRFNWADIEATLRILADAPICILQRTSSRSASGRKVVFAGHEPPWSSGRAFRIDTCDAVEPVNTLDRSLFGR